MPTTEFIRSEGMGGGVGGMVYSVKDDGNGGDSIISSHANHRGDVIARSNESRSLISFALYEAYGTRPYEWGDDPDRQKANTKEEETDLGLLNEGFRYRDLETGTFLTRDPLGFRDGPNVYCYVHCNPIMSFDAWGLNASAVPSEDDENETEFSFDIDVVFDDPDLDLNNKDLTDDQRETIQNKQNEIVDGIKASFMKTYNGSKGDKSWSLDAKNLNITVVASSADVGKENHAIIVTSKENMPNKDSNGYAPPAVAELGGGAIWINSSSDFSSKTTAHEAGHFFGVPDTYDKENPNVMHQTVWSKSTDLTPLVVNQMKANYKQEGAMNNNLGPRTDHKEPQKIDNLKQLDAAQISDPADKIRVF